jgi:multidrug resistance efflux pump
LENKSAPATHNHLTGIHTSSDTVILETNEIDDIVSEKPPFIVRRGISLLFGILLMILLVSWFIQYPDIVAATGVLNSINAPKEVITHTSGKLINLYVKEQQKVQQNEILAHIESVGDVKEVMALSNYLGKVSSIIERNEDITGIEIAPLPFKNLGELQGAYQTFVLANTVFVSYLKQGFYQKKKALLNNDMAYLTRLNSTLLEQRALLEQDLKLSDSTFKAQETLKRDDVISALDFRNERSKLLSKEIALPQISSSIINNENSKNQKIKEIAELENEIQQQKSLFAQALNTLISEVEEWKKKYLIVAGIDGKVSFLGFIQENQQLKQDQIVGFINPENSSYFVEAVIPQYNFGKVNVGQEVLLKFISYPHEEFGKVNGKIDFISDIPSDSGYIAKISLPYGLVTNYNKRISYHTGLNVQIEIITSRQRLLARIGNSLRAKVQQ